MAELPSAYGQATFEPPIACTTCGADVATADVMVGLTVELGRAFRNHIEVGVRPTSATVTAKPCGHVIHQSSPEDTPTGEQP